MLNKLLRNTEWKQLTAFVSPAFFDVVSVRKLITRGRSLHCSRGSQAYRSAVDARAQALAWLPLCVQLTAPPKPPAPPADDLGEGESAHAHRVVTLYFHQLYSDSPTLLDLRAPAFRVREGRLQWKPAPWVCKWDPAFLVSLRDVYTGFYDDDDDQFRGGLEGLGIEVAEDVFRRHFASDKHGHVFVMSDFVRTFHEVFVRCRDRGVRLHPEFLALGVYLASLYDHLDGKEIAVDVGACHDRAKTGAQARRAAARGEARA